MPKRASKGAKPDPVIAQLREALVRWYDGSARDLPWRRTRDPYAIWVSEVMLQQTRVDTVLRYYDRFLARFPTTHALAAAHEDDVMAAWSGLGYYRRARLLHAGVREVVARHGGDVPRDAEARRALPGVGRYTAGAIGSIAFEAEEPIVDGNVVRVLCRIHGIDGAPDKPEVQRTLWEHAERLVRGPRPSALNQALMELGALVCSKAAPRCAECPVRERCVAAREGRTAELPRVRARKPPTAWSRVALVATAGRGTSRRVLLVRGQGELFGALWNLPMADGADHAAAAELAERLGLPAPQPEAAARVQHVLSHRAIDLQVFSVQLPRVRRDTEGARMLPLSALSSVGVSQLTRKALSATCDPPL